MNFYNGYEDRYDRLGKNDDWKISFYNYYKPCDLCEETFLKSDLVYVTTGNDDPENMVETLRLCGPCLTTINHEHDERIFNRRKKHRNKEFFLENNDKNFNREDPDSKKY